jgi:hypothetical protein
MGIMNLSNRELKVTEGSIIRYILRRNLEEK